MSLPLFLVALLGCDPSLDTLDTARAVSPSATLEGWYSAERSPGVEVPEEVEDDVRRFYERRQWRPAWVDDRRESRRLLRALAAADNHGLDPETYHATALAQRVAAPPAETSERLALDLALTRAALLYARHLLRGRADPPDEWPFAPREADLAEALSQGPVDEALEDLAPAHPEYEALREALALYRQHAADGWPEVRGPDDPALAGRLEAEGYDVGSSRGAGARVLLEPQDGPGADSGQAGRPVHGEGLDEAVRAFQEEHGLAPDGIVGAATLRELNRAPEERVDQIALNLERWRWMPEDLGATHVRVHVPAFRLDLWRDGGLAASMAVVVGREDWQTPLLSDTIEEVVLNPWWNVPRTIAAADVLPKARADPTWLSRNGFVVLDEDGAVDPEEADWERGSYRFRQRPGPNNAMGRLKIRFPNARGIYLHDTPHDHLFEHAVRDFSHGCIRVERPYELAAELLGWRVSAVREAVDSGEHRTVPLEVPVPIHLLYFTVEVDGDVVRFHPDVYGTDAALP